MLSCTAAVKVIRLYYITPEIARIWRATMSTKIILENPPSGVVNLNFNEESSTFKIVKADLPELAEGQVLLKLLYFSNDPTQRNWMGANQDADRAYVKPMVKGDTIYSLGLGEVLESKSSKYSVGDKVTGFLGWADKLVAHEAVLNNKVDESLPLPLFLSSLGMTGLTAYFGLTEVGQLKAGQSVLISAASGATGSMAVQIAKHIVGAGKVIGIAGSDEKCKWVESLGADYCVNYRDADWKEKLSKYIGTDFVDVYYDNVGGDMLSFALRNMARGGRVIACGAIAGYNDHSKMNVTSWAEIITSRLTVQGFIVSDFKDKFPVAIGAIVGALKAGKLQVTEAASVVDLSAEKEPLEDVPKTWFKLFTDEKPKGKLLTKIA